MTSAGIVAKPPIIAHPRDAARQEILALNPCNWRAAPFAKQATRY